MIPQLRFPEFEGEWSLKKAGDLCDCIVPGRNKPKKFNGTIPWITTPDIKNTLVIEKSQSGLAITEMEAKNVGSKIVPRGSIIISCVGELGIVAKVNNEIVINQQLHAFIPKEDLNNWFLLYELSIKKRYMEKVATKTAVPYMNKDNCNSIPIIYPKIEEQIKVANFLTAVDKRITLKQKKKAELEQYKKGVMQKLFSQEIRFKKDDGSDFPDWEEKKLGEVAKIKMGQSPNSKSYNLNGDGLPLIQGNADITNRFSNPRQWTNQLTKTCDIGDLILTVRAPVGSISKSKHNACIGRGVCSIKNRSNSSLEFIYQFLLWYEPKWISLEQGSTFTAVSGKDIQNLKFEIPDSKDEQTKIANFLSSIDKAIEKLENQIEQSQNWKQGLLQKMFV